MRPSPVIEFSLDPYYYNVNPYWDVIIRAVSSSIVVPPTPVSGEVDQKITEAYDVILQGTAPVEQVLLQLQEVAQGIIDRAWERTGGW